jgi:Leucine-rich repeat (LRR) protein
VLGELSCEVLYSNDNVTKVTGDAHIKYAYDGNYNHGSITIDGITNVPYLLNSDHDSGLNPSPKTVLINYYGDYDDFFVYDYYSEDLPNVMVKTVLEEDEFDQEKFVERVKTGKSPFKKGVKPSRILVENEIKKLAKKNKTGEGLKELDLTEKKLQKLPKAIFDLETLKVLKLDKNSFDIVPKEISQLIHLKELSFRNTPIEELPEEIGQLKNLEVLNLSYCQSLKKLPVAIGELSNLKKLILWSFKGEVPTSISKLANLEELDINNYYGYGVEPTPFPSWILSLTGLKKLKVNENSFQNLPAELVQLTNLEELNLNGALCYVEDFPDLSSLTNLKKLYITGRTNLTTRPLLAQETLQHFFNITTLEYLDISSFNKKDDWMPTSTVEKTRAELQDKPEKLALFESHLNLHSNGNYYYDTRRNITLADFKGLDNLTNLKELDIRFNNLNALPSEVLNLKQLEKIHIYGNDFTQNDMDTLRQLNPEIEIITS